MDILIGTIIGIIIGYIFGMEKRKNIEYNYNCLKKEYMKLYNLCKEIKK